MVPPLGIEPSSRVLQTRAEMTTLAQAAYMVLIAGFEPAASDLPSQRSSPDLYQHVMEGGLGYDPSHLLSKSSICSNRFTPNCLA